MCSVTDRLRFCDIDEFVDGNQSRFITEAMPGCLRFVTSMNSLMAASHASASARHLSRIRLNGIWKALRDVIQVPINKPCLELGGLRFPQSLPRQY